MIADSIKLHSTVPVISTDDIAQSIKYYAEVLGFQPDFQFGDPVSYAGVKSADAEIYFAYDPSLTKLIRKSGFHPEIFIWLDNAEDLFQIHTKSGAEIIETIADRPWGARQYVVRDINGYHLKFAQPI